MRPSAPTEEQATIYQIIEDLVAEWSARGSLRVHCRGDINMGDCAEFAQDAESAISEKLPQATVRVVDSIDVLESRGLQMNDYHVAIEVNGRFYDAECPEGTASFWSLPWMLHHRKYARPIEDESDAESA